MPRVHIVTLETAAVAEAPEGARGPIDTLAFFNKAGDPLHMRLNRLGPHAEFGLEGSMTDHVVFVWQGAVVVADTRLGERASLIVEKGAAARLKATSEGASVLIFNSNRRPTAPRAGGRVHLLPSERVPRTLDIGGTGVAGGALHADAGCPTCEVWLHENDFYKADYEVAVHSHTEDEIIFVRAGSARLGNRLYGPGTALAITANTKYGFRAGPDGLSFVNFRAMSPSHVSADGSHVLDEAKLWRDHVGAPDYFEPV